jgi:hypothetical protein
MNDQVFNPSKPYKIVH